MAKAGKRKSSGRAGAKSKPRVKGSSRSGYNPSLPGEFPHKRTGNLRASVNYRINPKKLSVRIGASAFYGKWLEFGTKKMAARPFVGRTIREENSTIVGIFKEKVT